MNKNIIKHGILFLFLGSFVFAVVYNGILWHKEKKELETNYEIVYGVVI